MKTFVSKMFIMGMILFSTISSSVPAPTTKEIVCQDTQLIIQGILDYYFENNATFHEPYYWWEGGLAFNNMIENAYLCQNNTFDSLIQDALLKKSGKNFNYMPEDQIMVEANDDLGIWGMTLLTAAERNLSVPSNGTLGYDNIPNNWIYMADNVYQQMLTRWNNKTLSQSECGGGLRWQIYPWNNGYSYKNTISNAGMFQMAARLGKFFNNPVYLKQADEVFTWLRNVGFVNLDGNQTTVYDGANLETDCKDITEKQWSYNFGMTLGGCAYMYNVTGSDYWFNATESLWNGTRTRFFNDDGIMYESQCQPSNTCNNDQRAFKGLLSVMLEYTSFLVPELQSDIMKYMTASADAAAGSCDGGFDKHSCGLNWFDGTNDGYYGLGEQISALGAIQSVLGDSNDELAGFNKIPAATANYLSILLQHKSDNVDKRDLEVVENLNHYDKREIIEDENSVYNIMNMLINLEHQLKMETYDRKKLEKKVINLERDLEAQYQQRTLIQSF